MTRHLDAFAASRWIPRLGSGLVLLFLAAPLLVVIPAAFNNSALLQFPPRHWSLRWFHQYLDSASWIDATLMSLRVGLVVALLSTAIGLATAVVLTRFSFIGRNVMRALVMAPLVVPVIVLAVGLYDLFGRLGINGTFWALVIGHLTVTVPYATVVIGAALTELDIRLEDAAVGLGAIRPRAFLWVTFPLLRPGLAVAALFGFLISFDEVVIATFITSPETMTLPRRIWDGIRFELNPTIAAVSTILIALSGLILVLSELLRRHLRRVSGLAVAAVAPDPAPAPAAPDQVSHSGSVGAMPDPRHDTAPPQGAAVTLRNITKRYGDHSAVDDMSLAIAPGEFVSLLGPSGSGKTTSLMMVAGFTVPSAGTIRLGDQDITRLPPHRRNIGMVYQNYALFPHMNVGRNIAFPLRMRGIGRAEIARRVHRTLALVQLAGLEDRLPNQLSGGQQQRVALARALVFAPPLLLMDEPLGALDKKLREELQVEIKRLQRETRSTVIYVTHDQEEALGMSDRVVVMNRGRIEQMGAPSEIYERPLTRFVASFLGSANFLEAVVERNGDPMLLRTAHGTRITARGTGTAVDGQRLTVAIRPERIHVGPHPAADGAGHRGRILDASFHGTSQRYQLRLDGGDLLTAFSPNSGAPGFPPGMPVAVRWSLGDAWVIPEPS